MTPNRTTYLRIRPWLLAWVLITLGCSIFHYFVWNPPLAEGSAIRYPRETTLKLINNAIQFLILPAWILIWKFMGRFQDLPTTLLANALGWGTWLLVIYRAVRRWKDPPQPRAMSARPSPAASTATTRTLATNPARRRFLARAGMLTFAGAAAPASAVSTMVLPWQTRLARYRVPIQGLPLAFDGLRIVQISDTHLGPRIPRTHISRAIELAVDLKPDLVALTGDYIHMGTWYISPAVELFSRLIDSKAIRCGVVAVLGNHDHYGDPDRITAELTRIGVRVLDNSRTFITAGDNRLLDEPPASDALCIAGVGDLLEGTVDIDAALRNVPESIPRILLAHHPDSIEMLAGRDQAIPRIDLQLSGHTHGGQVAIPGYGPPIVPSQYGRRFAHGLVRSSACPMIVSAGIGMSIMPIRIGVPPEIAEITLAAQ